MLNKIDGYITRQIMGPLVLVLVISAMLLLLERMLVLFDLVINEGGPVILVWKMLANLMPHYLSLAIPLSLFLGVLLAFRNLSASSETDILQASGIGFHRLVRPAMILAFGLMCFNFILVGYIQPYARYTFRGLEFDLRSGALGASIKAGEYNELGDNLVLRIEESRNQGAQLINVFAQSIKGARTISISAKEGSFLATDNDRKIILRLYDGVMIDEDPNRQSPTVLNFQQHDWPIDLPELAKFRERGNERLELTLDELWTESERTPDRRQAFFYRATFHRHIVRSLGLLTLPLIAIPLGLTTKRSNRSFGLIIGILILLIYHKVLEFGEGFASRDLMSPFWGMWVPFFIFTIGSCWVFYNTVFKVEKNPVLIMERLWHRSLEQLRSIPIFRPRKA